MMTLNWAINLQMELIHVARKSILIWEVFIVDLVYFNPGNCVGLILGLINARDLGWGAHLTFK